MSIQADLQNPELGYNDEGVSLTDPALYESTQKAFGLAGSLPPVAFRSKTFLELESEKVWTRSWAAIGLLQQIPRSGDLLPFTLGFHGLHVQRNADGSVAGRMNRHQHGGCRFVPVQCRTGMQTKCSITSCNYTRDADAMRAGENGENSDEMYKFVGLVPEKLHPVKLECWGPFIFVNLDPVSGSLADQLGSMLPQLPSWLQAPHSIRAKLWLDVKANWKEMGAVFLDDAEIDVRVSDGQTPDFAFGTLDLAAAKGFSELLSANGDQRVSLFWAFPNLLIAAAEDHALVAILQSTAPGKTLCRLFLIAPDSVSEERSAGLAFAWIARFKERATVAEALHQDHVLCGTASRPGTRFSERLPEDLAGAYLLNLFLGSRLCTEHKYYWTAPIMDAAMLMRGVR
jgi:hypothetical protein